MRHLAIIVLFAVSAFSSDLTVDHITVAGTQLDVLRQAFTSATGIPTEYGGPHSNHATEMATVSFPDGSYLELIAIQKNADAEAVATHSWATFMKNNVGPCAFAIRAPNMSALVNQLKSAGLEVGAPQSSGRTRPDGKRLDWETTDVGGQHGLFFPFLIRDLTPRRNRAYPSGKPTTDRIKGVALVVIGVADLNGAVAKYRRAFNLPEPQRYTDPIFSANLAWFAGTPVVLAKGLDASSWVARRVQQYGDAPCAFVFKFAGGVVGGTSISQWLGKPIYWQNEQKLGWRMGMQPNVTPAP